MALFGGTFDPFHNGHLRMAIEVRERLGIARVVFLPARNPPHKPAQPVTDASHRLAMASGAVAGVPGFEVSDLELRREGPSYSIDTVAAFRESDPRADLFFLIGADAFAEIATWHRYRDLLAATDFVLLPRPGAPAIPALPPPLRLEKEDPRCYSWTGEAYRLPGGRTLHCPRLPLLDIAASAVRDKVRHGRSILGLVPPDVARYIEAHRLYSASGEDGRP